MTDYVCPAEGCEFGKNEERSRHAVVGHINATNDGNHDYTDLKDQIDTAGDTDPEPPEEGAPEGEEGTGTDDTDDDTNRKGDSQPFEGPERADEGAPEVGVAEADEGAEGPVDEAGKGNDMASEDEYQQQGALPVPADDGDEPPDTTDETIPATGAGGAGGAAASGALAGLSLGVSPYLVVGVALAALIIYVLITDDGEGGTGGAEPVAEAGEGPDEGEDEAVGGLVA